MFTGLIEDVGELLELRADGQAARLNVRTAMSCHDIHIGDSIAVNGACLTVERVRAGESLLSFYCLNETLSRTNLKGASPGMALNLERALRMGDRLGGHLVAGHVDATADILEVTRREGDIDVRIAAPQDLLELLIPKGSIAVNGISLTIARLAQDWFSVRVIPHTWSATNLRHATQGTRVNLEGDLVGKFILRRESLRAAHAGRITWDSLEKAGFAGGA